MIPEWYRYLSERYSEFKSLKRDWDSYESDRPNKMTMANILLTMSDCKFKEFDHIFTTHMSNGGIYLQLNNGDREIMAEFDDADSVLASCLWATGENAKAYRVPFKYAWPMMVAWLMSERKNAN